MRNLKTHLLAATAVMALSITPALASHSMEFPSMGGCSPAGVVTQVPAGFVGNITHGQLTVFQPTSQPDVTVWLKAPDGTILAHLGPGEVQSVDSLGFTGIGPNDRPAVTSATQLLTLTAVCYPQSDTGFNFNATVTYVP